MTYPRRLNPLLYVLACLLAVPVMALRCFAFLYFASTTSNWAIVPALALAALIVVSRLHGRLRGIGALVLLAWYGCSMYFDGWHTIMARLAEGGKCAIRHGGNGADRLPDDAVPAAFCVGDHDCYGGGVNEAASTFSLSASACLAMRGPLRVGVRSAIRLQTSLRI